MTESDVRVGPGKIRERISCPEHALVGPLGVDDEELREGVAKPEYRAVLSRYLVETELSEETSELGVAARLLHLPDRLSHDAAVTPDRNVDRARIRSIDDRDQSIRGLAVLALPDVLRSGAPPCPVTPLERDLP